jgi:hypothetical protein
VEILGMIVGEVRTEKDGDRRVKLLSRQVRNLSK